MQKRQEILAAEKAIFTSKSAKFRTQCNLLVQLFAAYKDPLQARWRGQSEKAASSSAPNLWLWSVLAQTIGTQHGWLIVTRKGIDGIATYRVEGYFVMVATRIPSLIAFIYEESSLGLRTRWPRHEKQDERNCDPEGWSFLVTVRRVNAELVTPTFCLCIGVYVSVCVFVCESLEAYLTRRTKCHVACFLLIGRYQGSKSELTVPTQVLLPSCLPDL